MVESTILTNEERQKELFRIGKNIRCRKKAKRERLEN